MPFHCSSIRLVKRNFILRIFGYKSASATQSTSNPCTLAILMLLCDANKSQRRDRTREQKKNEAIIKKTHRPIPEKRKTKRERADWSSTVINDDKNITKNGLTEWKTRQRNSARNERMKFKEVKRHGYEKDSSAKVRACAYLHMSVCRVLLSDGIRTGLAHIHFTDQ